MPSVTSKDAGKFVYPEQLRERLCNYLAQKNQQDMCPEVSGYSRKTRNFKKSLPADDPDGYRVALQQSLEQLRLIEKGLNGCKFIDQVRRDLDRIAAQVKAKTKKQLKLQEPVVI